jgi:hypothetical protein
VAEADDDPTGAVADTVPWAVPWASCSVNGADEDSPAAIDTELALTDEPPLWVRATSMADPGLATTFWNWRPRRSRSRGRGGYPGRSRWRRW